MAAGSVAFVSIFRGTSTKEMSLLIASGTLSPKNSYGGKRAE